MSEALKVVRQLSEMSIEGLITIIVIGAFLLAGFSIYAILIVWSGRHDLVPGRGGRANRRHGRHT